jgi:putative membrane protein
MNDSFILFLKGAAMGAANVIPGVSGGTIALIAGIYERLINAIRHFDLSAVRLLASGRWTALWHHVDGRWLSILLGGVAVSIISLARLFEYLLVSHERYTMAFFFGLILLSIVYVARGVGRWNTLSLLALLIGTCIAVGIALLAPASENDSAGYLFLCGVLAVSSMILPGLSGSFVLILLGNYALVLGAISTFSMGILIPLALGCAFGLVVFSHVLAWVFKRYADATLALMTGFVAGSLVVIWPWKDAITHTVERVGKPPREVVTSYEWFLPQLTDSTTWIAVLLMVTGAVVIGLMERYTSPPEPSVAEPSAAD